MAVWWLLRRFEECKTTIAVLKRFCSGLQRLLPNYSGYFQEKAVILIDKERK